MTDEWETKPLGQILTLQRGYDLPKSQRRQGTVPIVSSSGPEDVHDVAMHEGPGVITGRYGTIGKVFFVKEPYWPLNTTLFVSDFKGNDPKFCYYLLNRFDFVEHSGKTGVPGVNRNDLHSVQISTTTDPKEQEAIAEALSDADGVIEGLERLIAKKRRIKQGAMQDLLTATRRLPGFSGEWEEVRLRDLLKCAPSYGINSAAVPIGSGGYDYLRITDIDEHGRIRKDGRAEVNHAAAAHYFLSPHDIVVARTGASTGKSHRYVGPPERTVYAGFLIKLSPALDRVSSSLLFHLMQIDNYWNWIGENSARSGQPGINGQQLSGLPMVIPPTIDEQMEISRIIDDMDAEIAALEARLEKARLVKEGMMQNLLTGRIRLV